MLVKYYLMLQLTQLLQYKNVLAMQSLMVNFNYNNRIYHLFSQQWNLELLSEHKLWNSLLKQIQNLKTFLSFKSTLYGHMLIAILIFYQSILCF